jgi:hypothetical protein
MRKIFAHSIVIVLLITGRCLQGRFDHHRRHVQGLGSGALSSRAPTTAATAVDAATSEAGPVAWENVQPME